MASSSVILTGPCVAKEVAGGAVWASADGALAAQKNNTAESARGNAQSLEIINIPTFMECADVNRCATEKAARTKRGFRRRVERGRESAARLCGAQNDYREDRVSSRPEPRPECGP